MKYAYLHLVDDKNEMYGELIKLPSWSSGVMLAGRFIAAIGVNTLYADLVDVNDLIIVNNDYFDCEEEKNMFLMLYPDAEL